MIPVVVCLVGLGLLFAVSGPTILWYGFGPEIDRHSQYLARVVLPSCLLVGGALAVYLLRLIGVLP